MSELPQKFIEDRELRDSARAVFLADLGHARGALSRKGLFDRFTGWIGGRVGTGAKDVAEVAAASISANRSGIALLITALVVWFSRDAITEFLGVHAAETEEGADDASPGANADAQSDEDLKTKETREHHRDAREEPLHHPSSGEIDVR